MYRVKSETGLYALVNLFKNGVPDGQSAMLLVNGMKSREAIKFIDTVEYEVKNNVTSTQIVEDNISIEVVYYDNLETSE